MLTAVSNLSFRFRLVWPSELVAKSIFYLAGILLIVLLAVIVTGIVDFYRSMPLDGVLAATIQMYQRISPATILFGIVGIISLWILLRFFSRETLVVLSLTQIWGTKSLEYVIRLLGSLPTLILGNAILVLSATIDIHPHAPIMRFAFILFTLVLIGLPTVLQIGQEVLKDYDRKQIQQAVALGLSRIVIGEKVVMPSIRRSFNAAVTLAVSRVIIEAYIVLNQVTFNIPGSTRILRDSQDLLDIFTSMYSTVTIQSNVGLIILLFTVALLINFWSFSAIALQRP